MIKDIPAPQEEGETEEEVSYVVHAKDCPALCQRNDVGHFHQSHACACNGKEWLADLQLHEDTADELWREEKARAEKAEAELRQATGELGALTVRCGKAEAALANERVNREECERLIQGAVQHFRARFEKIVRGVQAVHADPAYMFLDAHQRMTFGSNWACDEILRRLKEEK